VHGPVAGDPGGCDVFIEVLFQLVMAGDFVFLAVFLVQANPGAPSLGAWA
jgi:hypothetical protein